MPTLVTKKFSARDLKRQMIQQIGAMRRQRDIGRGVGYILADLSEADLHAVEQFIASFPAEVSRYVFKPEEQMEG